MLNFKFCMLEIDQNILSKIKVSNISWFQNNKKTRNAHVSLKWWFNPKTKWWPMRFHKKIIDGATLFSNFQTIIYVLSLHTDLAYARDDLLLTPVMITSSTKLDLPFADQLSHLLTETLALFISLIWIMLQK